MTTDYKTIVIVLSSKEVKEYDRLYHVFSREYGRKVVIGIGIRKLNAKLASGLEPLNLSEIFLIKCRRLDRVKGVIIEDQHENIRKNLEKLVITNRLMQVLTQLLPEGEPHQELFDFLVKYLKFLATNSLPLHCNELFYLASFFKTISWCGYTPRLFVCANCGLRLAVQKKYAFFVPSGIKCFTCQSDSSGILIYICQDTIKLLRLLLEQEFEIIKKIKTPKQTLRETRQILRLMLENILEKKVEI